MKIGLVSDSHGNVRVFEEMLAVPGATEKRGSASCSTPRRT